MIIIFDLDYTLLDSKKFRAGLAAVLELAEKEYAAICEEIFKSKNIHYNFQKYLGYLISRGLKKKNEQVKINKKLRELLKRMDDYLFPCAEQVLSEFEAQGNMLVLLTYGDKQWQKIKVKNLKIKKYFKEIIFVEDAKETALGFLKDSKEKICIINDNALECVKMKKKLENAGIFLIKGPYSYNVEHSLEVHRLEDCLDEQASFS